jgi:hypothetical protein
MARKRMLSPEIWESESFSSLSDTAKIVFISLISHADDEGRGKANAGFVKSMTFPYDEGKRITDITKALNEIAQLMSVRFYKYDGSEYYCLTKWSVWQKIDKPSKSKIPPPTTETDRGVGELLPESGKNEKFDEHSANTSRILDEASATKENRIEKNKKRIEERNACVCAPACEGQALVSHQKIKEIFPFIIVDDKYKPKRTLQEYLQAKSCIEKSDFARTVFKRLRDIDNHFDDIVGGKYKNFQKGGEPVKVERTYKSEQLNAMFSNLSIEDL